MLVNQESDLNVIYKNRNRMASQLAIGGLALACFFTGLEVTTSRNSPNSFSAKKHGLSLPRTCEPVCLSKSPPRERPHNEPVKKTAKHIVVLKQGAPPFTTRTVEPKTVTPAPSQPSKIIVSTRKEPATKPLAHLERRKTFTPTDISYPQCKTGFPIAANFGIVGVNKGRSFTYNPCLQTEASLYSSYDLYFNAEYLNVNEAKKYSSSPDQCGTSETSCDAYNYGYAAGSQAAAYAAEQGAGQPKALWIDVETENSWNGSTALHQQTLLGEAAGLSHAMPGKAIGYYSTVHMWQVITGSWQNGMPGWIASGSGTYDEAAPYCQSHSFTGGKLIMAQFTSQFDENIIC